MREKSRRLTGGNVCWMLGNVLALLICIGIFMCLFSGCGKVAGGNQTQYPDSTQAVDPGEVSVNKGGSVLFFVGEKSAADTAEVIQRRASLYLAENQ